MAANLIPVKTGNEQFPVYYQQYLPALKAYNTILSCVSTIQHKVLYVASLVQIATDSAYTVRIYSINLLTGRGQSIGVIPYTTFGSSPIGAILVDDNYIYISRMVSVTTIYKFRLDDLTFVQSYQYAASAPQAYGKMQWFNDRTICMAYANGFLFFDTIDERYTYKSYTTSYASQDMAVGKYVVITNQNIVTSNSVFVYDTRTDTYSTFSLTSTAVAVSCYDNGKFYIANAGYLYIVDENTLTMESIVTSWPKPRSINVSNNTVFISAANSNKIYLYDMKERYTRSIIIHWTIPDFNSSYTYIPSTLSGLYFFPYYTILQMDYSGYFKYNFGPKSMDMSILYNSDNDSHFTYDERFVEFTESYVTIHDGMITKQLQPFDPVNSIKSIPMNRSEYNVIKRLVLQQPIEDDT